MRTEQGDMNPQGNLGGCVVDRHMPSCRHGELAHR